MAAGLLVAVTVAAYVTAAARVRRPWPMARTAAFMGGAAAVALGLVVADDRRFTAHAFEHLLLGMVAPALFALGAPVTLALRSLVHHGRRRLLRALHSPLAAVIGHPLVAWGLFGGSMAALYLTPLYPLSLDHAWLHEVLHAHLVATGTLFFWAVMGLDPGPRRLPHGGRVLMVFLTVPFHAVLGMALLASGAPLSPEHTLPDHRAGAGVLWAGGDLLGLVAVLVVVAQWMAHEERQAVREDRRADRLAGGHARH